MSSMAPILTAEGGALPTSWGVESDSLEARAGIIGYAYVTQMLPPYGATLPLREGGWQQNEQSRKSTQQMSPCHVLA